MNCVPVALTLILLWGRSFATGEIDVTDENFNVTYTSYKSKAATFGQAFPDEGLSGRAVRSNPDNACRSIQPPPDEAPTAKDPSSHRWIVVISRGGGCSFEQKIRRATNSSSNKYGDKWSAVIIYNDNGRNNLVPMAGGDDNLIPSTFMGYDDAQVLLEKYSFSSPPSNSSAPGHPKLRIIIINDADTFDINQYLLPFAIVVGICFIIMLVIVIYKCFQDYRRHRRHRLPKSALKKLPIHKFKEGDPFETCCICLDDFQDGDKLRVLPCDHGYHAKCIDPWLVKTKRICPQCRKRVFASNERGAGLLSASDRNSDSDSDAEAPHVQRRGSVPSRDGDTNASTGQASEDTSANAPLLGRRRREFRFFRRESRSSNGAGQRSRRAAGGGTFTSQSSVDDPPNVNVNSAEGDGQRAGPSGTNHQNLSAVERLQRAFARETRESKRRREEARRNLMNDSSSDDEYNPGISTDDTSDDEEQATSPHHPYRRTSGGNDVQNRVRSADGAIGGVGLDLQPPTQALGARSKTTARHVNAEVHVVPLDDKNVTAGENEEVDANTGYNVTIRKKSSKKKSERNLSETTTSQNNSHIVEIHPEQLQGPPSGTNSRHSRGASSSSTDHTTKTGGNVENV